MSAIGIDLGTTYSCVGVVRNGKVEILENGSGDRTTPSVVSFSDDQCYVGESAKVLSPIDPKNTVFDSKRMIGRSFHDPIVQADMKDWPFKVVEANGRPKFEVEYKGGKETFYPEEISSMVLNRMKQIADSKLGKNANVKDVVVTIPARFNHKQHEATKRAAEVLGLNVLRIINEPTAAAIAYGLDQVQGGGKKTILVFDLGGGTFDVSILAVQGGHFDVKATFGDTHLGGEDFDKRMVKHLVKKFYEKYKKDISGNQTCLARLKLECEKAKRTLSTSEEAKITVYGLDGIDFVTTISRPTFERLNADYFRSILEPVEKALKDANLKKCDINDIVMVGGSARIPKVQKLVKDFFNGKELINSINPDEAVAFGAAIQAAMLVDEPVQGGENMLLLDITPLSLGIGIHDGTVTTVVKRNTTIPTQQVHNFTTVVDNQEIALFEVYQGDRVLQKDNTLLASFDLKNLPPALRGVPSFKVTFEIDANGIVDVSAVDTSTGKNNKVIINNDRLSNNEIDKMLENAKRFQDEDERVKAQISAKSSLQSYVEDMKFMLKEGPLKDKISDNQRSNIVNQLNETLEWIDSNQRAQKYEYDRMLSKMKCLCQNVIGSLL